MSLLTSFDTGVSGLTAAQAGLNTTAHNIANTGTTGYTRQQNISSDNYYQTIKTTSYSMLQVGSGTSVALVRQIRDTFLDSEYRTEIGIQSFYEVQYTTATEIEDILGELEGTEFDDQLTDLWEAIENLSTNPESVTNRQLLISQAQTFLETAQDIYRSLQNYQINLNTQISEQVDRVNEIADEILTLNRQIARVEASGLENANDLRDARNLLLDELATYTSYDAYEDASGNVIVRINNAPLVDESQSYHMQCEAIEGSFMCTVTWESSGYGEVYHIEEAFTTANDSNSGSLISLLAARGTTYGYYTDIPQDIAESGEARTDALNEYNTTIGNCLLQRVEAQLDLLVHEIVTLINDAFSPNTTVDLSDYTGEAVTTSDGKTSTLADVLEAQGITDAENVKILDVVNCTTGTDDDETIGTEVFSRKTTDRYEVYTLGEQIYYTDEDGNQIPLAQETTDGNGNTVYKLYVYNEENEDDVDSLYTMQNLGINENLLSDYNYLAVMSNPSSGSYGEYNFDIYTTIMDSWNSESIVLDPNSLSKYSIDGFYDSLVGALGTQGSIWKSIVENQESLTESIDNERQQISGVSTAEEMVNLLMYQHAYNASSRYITVIDEMLEHIITSLG